MYLETKSEVGGIFLNAKDGTILRTSLKKMVQKQPTTPFNAENTTATGITNMNFKQRSSKAIIMGFYWIQYCVKQGQFVIFWKRGYTNLSDYFTKTHATAHHLQICDVYLPNPTL